MKTVLLRHILFSWCIILLGLFAVTAFAEDSSDDAEPPIDIVDQKGLEDEHASLLKSILGAISKQLGGQHEDTDVMSNLIGDAGETTLANGDGDIDTTGKCAKYIDLYCPNETPGFRRLWTCLWKQLQNDNVELDDKCTDELTTFEMSDMENVNNDVELAWTCREDYENYCMEEGESLSKTKDKVEKGQALQCLKENVDQLTPTCADLVHGKIKISTADWRFIPSLYDACKSDAEKICANIKEDEHGAKYECLKTHLNKASFKCQKEVFAQEQLTVGSGDFLLARKLHESCTLEHSTFCNEESGAQVMPCLEENMNDVKFGRVCKEELEKVISARTSDFRLDGELKRMCAKDIDNFCAYQRNVVEADFDKREQALVVSCLQDNKDQLRNTDCRNEVFRLMTDVSENFDYDATLSVCGPDDERFCQNIESGNGKKLECLRSHEEELDGACRGALFRRDTRYSGSIEFKQSLKESCHSEIKKYCENEGTSSVEGDVLICLEENMTEHAYSAHCMESMVEFEHESTKDFRKDVNLATVCKSFIKDNCDFECMKNDEDCDGKVIDCLKEKYDDIPSMECKESVSRVEEMGNIDVKNDKVFLSNCIADVNKFCEEESKVDTPEDFGNVYACLQKNNDKITNGCQKQVKKQFIRRDHTLDMHPEVGLLCETEISKYCSEKADKGAENLKCLMTTSLVEPYNSKCERSLTDMMAYVGNVAGTILRNEVYETCKSDLNNYCDVRERLDFDVKDDVKAMQCLLRNLETIGTSCKKSMTFSLQTLFRFYSQSLEMTQQCDEDLESQCKEKTGLDMFLCVVQSKPPYRNKSCGGLIDITRGASNLSEKQVIELAEKLRASTLAELAAADNENEENMEGGNGSLSASSGVDTASSGVVLTGWVALLAVGALVIVLGGASYYAYIRYSGQAKYRPYTIVTKSGDI